VKKALLTFALVFSLAAPGVAQDTTVPILSGNSRHHPVEGYDGMVSSQERLATEAGVEVLREGGNAVDAAVTTAFALAVTLPRAGNLGGGGFMVVHLAETNETIAINYRETAPAAAHRDLFLDAKGNPDAKRSRNSLQASGVPGSVAGLCLALEKYGTISLERAIAPAIKLAEKGFIVSEDLADNLRPMLPDMKKTSPAAAAAFSRNDGTAFATGDRITQADLAATLKRIAEHGADDFYRGETAKRLVAYMIAEEHEPKGLITLKDLHSYQPHITEAVTARYRDFEVATMPPPSSGFVLLQILKLLEPHDLRASGSNSAQSIHLFSEACKLAYADRTRYLGDARFIDVPIQQLLSADYLSQRGQLIDPDKATKSEDVTAGDIELKPKPDRESNETTHFSVMDKFGNAVSTTTTLNFSYGNRHMAPGTGFLLNNEMDDFVSKPGEPNAFGLLGGKANAIEPGKRMASSMCPTIVFRNTKNGRQPFLVTGSPGGSRIITTVAQVITNVIDQQMNVAAATHAPRVHHQWYPDELRIEPGLSPDTLRLLEERGHKISLQSTMGSTQSILTLDGKRFSGSSDPRRVGAGTAAVSVTEPSD
jgi:gamma-glutamyltranspeptidase/glutathione hydrolase